MIVNNKIFPFSVDFHIQLIILFNIIIKRLLQLLCIILFFCISLKAQTVLKKEVHFDFVINSCIDQLHEEVYLHLNRWSIVVGERLFFKAYVINKNTNTNNSSKVLYIEIFDEHNKIKAFSRSNIYNGFCKSSILIPDSLKTGLYKIIAYTNLMRNFPASSFLRSSMIIIGMNKGPVDRSTLYDKPDSMNNESLLIDQTNNALSLNRTSNILLNGKVDKQVYNRKEKVVLSLELKDSMSKTLNGNFSVSVFEKLPENYMNLNNDISLVNSILSGGSNTKIKISDDAYKELLFNNNEYTRWLEKVKNHVISFPHKSENKCFLLEGTLFEKSSQKAEPGKTIFLSTPDSFANLKYSTTDSAGKFIFALDRSYDNRTLILCIKGNSGSKEFNYLLENKQVIDSTSDFEPLKMDSLMNEFLIKSKKIAVINKVYYNSKDYKIINKLENGHNHFYGKPDYTVHLSDYIELEDFNDISKNLLPDVKFRKKKDHYLITFINLLSILENNPDKNCLVLLNNIPFYDYEYLSTLGSNQIDRIDVNFHHLVYGNLDFYGILSVYTKDKVMISNRQALIYENKIEDLSLTGVAEKTANNALLKLPDFKQVLYWNPDLVFDVNGNAKLEFNTSDLAAEYIIDIEGLTDNGIPVSKKILFNVQ